MDEMSEHDFDWHTYFCLRCGSGVQDVHEKREYECLATENVVAISHRVRGQILRKVSEAIV
jgi:hypothetical protein